RARGPRGNRGSGKGDPRQPDPGTRPSRYRCSLPGLTGFTTGRRGGTDADLAILTDDGGPCRADGGAGGEGGIRTHGTGLPYTCFPSKRLRPLGHLSAEGAQRSPKSGAVPTGKEGCADSSGPRFTQRQARGYATAALGLTAEASPDASKGGRL